MEFPSKVQTVIDQLKSELCSDSVWFIGSRANSNSRLDSDWDFICFRNSTVEEHEARSELVDIVQVGNDGQYLLEGQHSNLIGQFKNWHWCEIDLQNAQYKSRVRSEEHTSELQSRPHLVCRLLLEKKKKKNKK